MSGDLQKEWESLSGTTQNIIITVLVVLVSTIFILINPLFFFIGGLIIVLGLFIYLTVSIARGDM